MSTMLLQCFLLVSTVVMISKIGSLVGTSSSLKASPVRSKGSSLSRAGTVSQVSRGDKKLHGLTVDDAAVRAAILKNVSNVRDFHWLGLLHQQGWGKDNHVSGGLGRADILEAGNRAHIVSSV